tara:strand:+ start:455 stop:1318 length:864 start_codon:yes stop_codon:yes gene_type:complete
MNKAYYDKINSLMKSPSPKESVEYIVYNIAPGFEPGQIVTAICNNSKFIRCTPTPWENIKCPMCRGDKGIRVVDGKETHWSCAKNECLNKNTTLTPGTSQIKDKVPSYQDHMKRACVPEDMQDASFDLWDHPEDMKDIIFDWFKNPKKFCVMTGEAGRGKSYISAAIIGHLMTFKGLTSLYVNCAEVKFEYLNQMLSSGPKTIISDLTKKDLLILDDIDKVQQKDSFYEFLYVLINSRYSSNKPTVITTNLSFDELHKHLGDALASRIYDKNGIFLEVTGRNRRIEG